MGQRKNHANVYKGSQTVSENLHQRREEKAKLKQKRRSNSSAWNRRRIFMRFATGLVILMAVSLVFASFTRKATAPTQLHANKTKSAPARAPANSNGLPL